MQRRELAFALGLGTRDPWAHLSQADYRLLVTRESPRRPPGARVRYSSMAVGLLGDALAARADQSYDQLLDERILAPLGMTSTAVTVPQTWTPRLLDGHSRRGRPRPPIQDFLPAAGSLRSTAADMLRFLAACLQPPPGRLGAALRLAQQPQARVGRRMEVGLCWLIFTRPPEQRVVWHNGGTWGFRAFAAFAPDRGTAAVVMSNTTRSVDRLGLRLV
jgi:CubicO group peptidase (beta-lactamase class C family)